MIGHQSVSDNAWGKLYLIPTPISKGTPNDGIPPFNIETAHKLKHFAVENLGNAVSFLKYIKHPIPEYELVFFELNKRTHGEKLQELLQLLLNGESLGVLTDAGCPGVADPGSDLVKLAHHYDIDVIPLTGPSSPILALMASGLGGQKFAFSGYLPTKAMVREKELIRLEMRSHEEGSTELFMEAPHRNVDVFRSALKCLRNDTLFSVAAGLTSSGAIIKTREVSDWKHRKNPEIDKIPAIFGLKALPKPAAPNAKSVKAVKKKFGR